MCNPLECREAGEDDQVNGPEYSRVLDTRCFDSTEMYESRFPRTWKQMEFLHVQPPVMSEPALLS
jgi:hypothetical protein